MLAMIRVTLIALGHLFLFSFSIPPYLPKPASKLLSEKLVSKNFNKRVIYEFAQAGRDFHEHMEISTSDKVLLSELIENELCSVVGNNASVKIDYTEFSNDLFTDSKPCNCIKISEIRKLRDLRI